MHADPVRHRSKWRGVYGILTTPFNADFTVDWAGVRANVDFIAQAPVDVVVGLGTGAEFYSLDERERTRLAEVIAEELRGRRPFVVGVSHPSTAVSVELARHAAANGADAVMTTAPYYVESDSSSMQRHLASIAQCGRPLFFYNIPARTGYHPSSAELLSWRDAVPLAGIKQSTPDITQLVTLVDESDAARWLVLGGSESTMWPAIAIGTDGNTAMAATAIPAPFAAMWRAAESNDLASGRAVNRQLGPLRTAYKQAGQVPVVKRLLDLVGLAGGPPRQPLASPDRGVDTLIQRMLQGLRDG